MQNSDLIRITVHSAELDFPIQLPFMKKSKLTVERLLSEIERVLQSFEQFILDGDVEMDIIHVRNPNGGTGADFHIKTLLKDKRCITQINNTDKLGCARGIVTAKARIDKHDQ